VVRDVTRQEANLVRQRCEEGFNSGVKGLILVFIGLDFEVSCSLKALQEKARIIRELF
jgi:hypothetical protein